MIGKRRKSKHPCKIETENGKPGKCNLNKKSSLSVLIRRINNCCESIFLSNINSGTSALALK